MTTVSAPKHWITWGNARGYSHSPSEEEAFVKSLEEFTGDRPARLHKVLPDRQIASLLLTMLRDGAGLPDLEAIAPNLDPRDVAKVYRDTTEHLLNARTAWTSLTEAPDQFDEYADAAARLMPQVINVVKNTPPEGREEMLTRIKAKAAVTTDKVDELERELHASGDSDERRNLHYSLARADSCLWDDFLFLPSRVGQLTPTRLSFILGELA